MEVVMYFWTDTLPIFEHKISDKFWSGVYQKKYQTVKIQKKK